MAMTTLRLPDASSAAASSAEARAGIEHLYRVERDKMLRLAHLLTGSPEVAEELVHEAFLNVQRNWHRAVRPGAYLRTAVVNACRSYHRSAARDRARVFPDAAVYLDPEVDDLWRAMASLNERQRMALVLRYYEDLTIKEIAGVLGCRVGTVKSLVHRGLARLKETLRDE